VVAVLSGWGDLVLSKSVEIFMSRSLPPFMIESLYEYVSDRRTASDDGMPISEWEVPLRWIRAFVSR